MSSDQGAGPIDTDNRDYVPPPLEWDMTEVQQPVSIVRPGEGEITLDGTLQVKLFETGVITSGRLAVGIATVKKGRNSGPQHRHQKHDEGFYIMSGRVVFDVAEETHVLGPGTFVMVPPGAPHGFSNPYDEDAAMLVTFSPSLYVGLFREMAEVMRADSTILEPVQSIARRYFTEFSDEYARPPVELSE